MAEVAKIDIDGFQWDIKDQNARNEINNINTKLSQITKNVFNGIGTFDVFMKYLGEDNNYIYYNFWWEPTTLNIQDIIVGFEIIPIDTIKDKIITLNMNIAQDGNPAIIQATQHQFGNNSAGMYTYVQNASNATNWLISGMGILRRVK